MPITFTIYPEKRLVVTIGSGQITCEEVAANQERMLADLRFDPSFNQLIDLTELRLLDLTQDEVKTVADRCPFSKTSMRAFVP